jgi:energy-coupling factor transporter ATP-binding protein EcfA2
MLLVSTHISYYRSVEDSEKFTVEPDVTCLVGKNESGKTNTAQALFRVNPAESATFDEVIDFPARMTAKKKEFPAGEMIPVVVATFRYDDDELARVEADLGPGALTSSEFTVTAGYRKNSKTFGHRYNETAIVEHLTSQLDLGAAAARPLKRAKNVAELLAALKELPEPTSATQALADRISGWRNQDVGYYLIDQYAMPMMPKFVYYADYDTMPGKVSIPDLIRRRDQDQLTRGERALLGLLDMADVNLEDFSRTDQHERLIRELENAGNAISDEVFEYWTQNKDLSVKLSVHPAEDGALPPLNEGPILFIRVDNHRHRATVPFDERSRGFVWFFSFLAYFSKLEEGQTSNLIVLLDEPGLSLHARAQQDLLRLIDERLAPHHQVIYTTHSPFMVSPGQFHRVRTVIDHEKGGSKVSAEIFKADDDTVSPLLTAMGIEMTQTLFIGEHTLLLEGPSDLIYLDVLSDLTETRQLTGLDPRWVKTPIGGSGKLSTFVTLLGANKLNVAVLVDSSTKDTGAVRRLRDNGQLARNGLVEISEFTGGGDADIEDLFDRDFYLELVNRAYASELSQPITPADLTPGDPRVVRTVEAYFKQHGIDGGRFNHYRPAAVLLREQATLLPMIADATINRADRLFTRLNGLLP